MKKYAVAAVLLTAMAFGVRLFIALRLPSDVPDDGRVYALLARNVLEHGSYSLATREPYPPTYIRLPGYPIFVAGVYRTFGIDNRAVRVVQAAIDTMTCWVIAMLALAWCPPGWGTGRRRRVLLFAAALAASCPFAAIYVGTILTETCAMLLVMSCALITTHAITATGRVGRAFLWAASGLLGGLATVLRADSAFFVAAAGIMLVVIAVRQAVLAWRAASGGEVLRLFGLTVAYGALLSVGVVLPLAPWTIRNAIVFGVFQPLAPVLPVIREDFVPIGYTTWLRTWVDDEWYTARFQWNVEVTPIHIEQAPDQAFDSADERDRVAALMERYNGATTGGTLRMTPEIDAAFAAIATERIARHPWRHYMMVPARRIISMWFDTHSQYYPFHGWLRPWSAIDRARGQQRWLPLFMALTWIYTALAAAGAWVMWRDGSRQWLLMLALLIVPRFLFLSSLANPEPRYTTIFFDLILAVAALALGAIWNSRPLRITTH